MRGYVTRGRDRVQVDLALKSRSRPVDRVRVQSGPVDWGRFASGPAERVPLTITPPPDKHRLDAEVAIGTGRKGMVPKAIARMRRGAAGCVAWNLATFSGALVTFPESSQVLASRL